MGDYNFNITEILGNYDDFLDIVLEDLKFINIDVTSYEIDHIAYRSTTSDSFKELGEKLKTVAKRINRNTIRNRFIDIYEFNTPLIYNGRSVKFIELTAPAEGDIFKEGLEHVEFIVNNTNLFDFVKKHNNLDWNLSAIDREIGADIGVRLKSGYGAKFKTMSMPEIIRLESENKQKTS